MTTMKSRTVALGLAGAFALAVAAPASAAPVMPNTTALKSAVSDHVTDVRWRGRGGRGIGPAVGFGIAAGALVGAAVAGSAYGPGYYYGGPGYAEPYGAYAEPYAYEPVYQAPSYGYGYPAPTYGYRPGYYGSGECTTDEGYGRRRAC
jgi:hypothetical protein